MSEKEGPARLRVVGSAPAAQPREQRKTGGNLVAGDAAAGADKIGPKRSFLFAGLLFLFGSAVGGAAVAWLG